MALSLLFGKRYEKGQVGSIELDVTLRESHKYSSRATTYPIEDGSILSDHIIRDPVIVVLEGVVTDTPISVLSTFNRSVDAFNRLVELHTNREVVTVVTGLKKYDSMTITQLNVPREIRTGQSLTFNIELQEIVVDTTVRLEIDQDNVFGGVQSKIPRQIVSSGDDIPLIQLDPTDSLKDQATSGTDIGLQSLLPIPDEILTRVDESKNIILGVT